MSYIIIPAHWFALHPPSVFTSVLTLFSLFIGLEAVKVLPVILVSHYPHHLHPAYQLLGACDAQVLPSHGPLQTG